MFYDTGKLGYDLDVTTYWPEIYAYKYMQIGTSNAYAFMPTRQRMGYHEDDSIYKYSSYIIDQIGYFEYLPLNKARLNAFRLIKSSEITYAAELLIKSNHIKMAELYVNEFPFSDIKDIVKKHPEILNNPSKNKYEFALATNIRYQRGMLKYGSYHVFDELFKIVLWKKFKQYNYNPIDYLDYRKDNRKYNLPDFPENLQKAKEKLQGYINKKNDRIDNVYFKKRKLPKFEYKGLTALPPKSVNDLRNNGVKLHHCILNYKQRYIDKKCDLYIVKDQNNEIASIEVVDKKIVQCRGKHNKDMTTTLKPLLNIISEYYEELAHG
jgi:hypothetical protein